MRSLRRHGPRAPGPLESRLRSPRGSPHQRARYAYGDHTYETGAIRLNWRCGRVLLATRSFVARPTKLRTPSPSVAPVRSRSALGKPAARGLAVTRRRRIEEDLGHIGNDIAEPLVDLFGDPLDFVLVASVGEIDARCNEQ